MRSRDLTVPVIVFVLIGLGVAGTFGGWRLTGTTVYEVLIIVVILAGFYLLFLGARDLLDIGKLKGGHLSSIASLSQGSVTLKGKARPVKPQKSPIGGEPCVYWKITGENYMLAFRGGSWNHVITLEAPPGRFFSTT